MKRSSGERLQELQEGIFDDVVVLGKDKSGLICSVRQD